MLYASNEQFHTNTVFFVHASLLWFYFLLQSYDPSMYIFYGILNLSTHMYVKRKNLISSFLQLNQCI